ncbi:hypothetical protein, partial [Streptococcus pneumoniae]|uniref:hypothetical protein n=2 Tax=Streptococcus pneumoniae TaxID=1313 RepID=UPI001C5B4B9E
SVLSATSKLYFEQPTASFLVRSLLFIEYKSAPGHILHSNSLLKMDKNIVKAIKKEYNECKKFRR